MGIEELHGDFWCMIPPMLPCLHASTADALFLFKNALQPREGPSSMPALGTVRRPASNTSAAFDLHWIFRRAVNPPTRTYLACIRDHALFVTCSSYHRPPELTQMASPRLELRRSSTMSDSPPSAFIWSCLRILSARQRHSLCPCEFDPCHVLLICFSALCFPSAFESYQAQQQSAYLNTRCIPYLLPCVSLNSLMRSPFLH